MSTFPPEWLPPEPPSTAVAPPPPTRDPERDPDAASWPLWTAFVALLCGFIGGSVFGAIVYAIADGAGHHDTDNLPIGYTLVANLLFDASLVGSAVVFARLGGGRITPRVFGLRSTPLWPALKWAAAAGVAYLVLSGIWLQLLNLSSETDDITKKLENDPTAATVAGLAVFALVVAPIAEELFFRGFVFTALRERLNPWWAAIGTGLLFGFVHISGSPIGFLPPLALLGFLLCLVYWKTGSIYPTIALHSLNNSIALASALNWGWQVPLLVVGAWAAIAAILATVASISGRVAAPTGRLG